MRRVVADGSMDGRSLARFAHSLSSKGIIRIGLERNDLILRGSVSYPMLGNVYLCAHNDFEFLRDNSAEKWNANVICHYCLPKND